MNKSPKIGYSLRLAVIGLFKNTVLTISSIFVLLSCLVIMGTFYLVIQNFNFNIEKIDGFNKIVLFVDKEADEVETMQIGEKLKNIKGVTDVEFISKEQALEEQVSQYSEAEFLLEMYKNNNPLKDSYSIAYDPNTDIETLKMNIELEIPHISKLNINMEVVKQIQNIKNVIAIIFSWLLILLFIVSLFVIINTIKLSVFSRRDEIALMRYIGATNTFISTPFLLEGLFIGLISAAVAYAMQFCIYKYLMLGLIDQYKIISMLPYSEVKTVIIIAFAAIGVITGLSGSLIALKKYNNE